MFNLPLFIHNSETQEDSASTILQIYAISIYARKDVMIFASAPQDFKVHFICKRIIRNGENVALHNLIKRTMTLYTKIHAHTEYFFIFKFIFYFALFNYLVSENKNIREVILWFFSKINILLAFQSELCKRIIEYVNYSFGS